MKRNERAGAFKSAPLSIHEPENFFIRFISSQRFIAFIALAFLVLMSFPLVKSYSRKALVNKEIEEMKARVEKFENENKEMKEMLEYISSKESAEAQARLNLNLKKPGEAVVVVEPATKNEADFVTAEDDSCSNFKKWWRYFFN